MNATKPFVFYVVIDEDATILEFHQTRADARASINANDDDVGALRIRRAKGVLFNS